MRPRRLRLIGVFAGISLLVWKHAKKSELLLVLLACLFLSSDSEAQGRGRESLRQIRTILAQSICLAEAYPDRLAGDSAAIIAAYQGTLGEKVTVDRLETVRNLAKKEKPAKATPVGGNNFGIARCVLFAERKDVLLLLR